MARVPQPDDVDITVRIRAHNLQAFTGEPVQCSAFYLREEEPGIYVLHVRSRKDQQAVPFPVPRA